VFGIPITVRHPPPLLLLYTLDGTNDKAENNDNFENDTDNDDEDALDIDK